MMIHSKMRRVPTHAQRDGMLAWNSTVSMEGKSKVTARRDEFHSRAPHPQNDHSPGLAVSVESRSAAIISGRAAAQFMLFQAEHFFFRARLAKQGLPRRRPRALRGFQIIDVAQIAVGFRGGALSFQASSSTAPRGRDRMNKRSHMCERPHLTKDIADHVSR